MGELGAGAAPEGWYPDRRTGGLRWWDGGGWTDHRRTFDAPGYAAPQPTPPRPGAVAHHNAGLGALDVAAGVASFGWGTIKLILGAIGLFILIGGFAMSRSKDFKANCLAQKQRNGEGGYIGAFQTDVTDAAGATHELSFPQNFLCDVDFEISSS